MAELFPDRDENIRPGDDLYQHVNGAWERVTEIPSDQASTGSFRVLRDNSEAAVHSILEELTSGAAHELRQAASESTDHEVELLAELYHRFMDADAVEDAGTGPLAPILARIDRVTTTSEFMTLLGQHYRESLGALFYLADESDPADPTHYVPWMGQAGLGLPDEAYYRDNDKAEIREAYQSHIAQMLTLAGLDDADDQAWIILDLETEIASHHWDQVRCRDITASFNPKSFDELSKAHPGLHLDLWREGAGIPQTVLATIIDNQPSFFDEVEPMLTDERLDQWKSWARWHAISSLAPFLTSTFVDENFDFYGRVLNGTPALKARWKRGVSFVESTWVRRLASCTSPSISHRQPRSGWTTSSRICWRHTVNPSRR